MASTAILKTRAKVLSKKQTQKFQRFLKLTRSTRAVRYNKKFEIKINKIFEYNYNIMTERLKNKHGLIDTRKRFYQMEDYVN